MNQNYEKFIASKKLIDKPTGLTEMPELNPMLFDFQKDIVRWALRRGRACIFADCGLGKTLMQLEWARHINGNVLIVAPLSVSEQTIREAQKFGIDSIAYSPDGSINSHITITNYERLEHFNPSDFNGVVLDESSIIKSFTGKIRNELIDNWQVVPFRLACTATPAPNDFEELGNHAEFMGAMTRANMLAMFFIHDGGETSKWRLKGHANTEFWKWICEWAVMIRKPSDLGYSDDGYILPRLKVEQINIDVKNHNDDVLFAMEAQTLQERNQARKDSVDDRIAKCVEIVNSQPNEKWLIWCELNSESEKLKKALKGSVEVKGSDDEEHKKKSLLDFANGDLKVLITKPKIAGMGMNFQSCHNQIFVGASDSFEQYYQAIRRCWRFGQDKEVNVYVLVATTQGAVVANLNRKQKDAEKLALEMVNNMHELNEENLKGTSRTITEYKEKLVEGENWKLYLGDCVESIQKLPDESVGFSVFSPPFASLYTYSNSDRDMGNSKDDAEFFTHFKFLIKELYRVLQTGRCVSFHCMNLPSSKERDGFIGIKDFRGDLIRLFQDCGFIYASEVCIWKDPVIAMQRTKAIGLLHKQVCKDRALSRQGIPDYLVTMRKLGENKNPISGEFDHFCGENFKSDGKLSIDVWQRYASPVWDDINPSDTLQYRCARDGNDERHICPLQLQVIHRALQLWSKEGDTVLSPFAGIGSEGYESLKLNRKFIGFELKESYFNQAVSNLQFIEKDLKSQLLF